MGSSKSAGAFVVIFAATIAVGHLPSPAAGTLEPFVSHLVAKKTWLKHGLAGPVPVAHQPPPPPQHPVYFVGQYYQPRPSPPPPPPPPSPTYPAYGPPSPPSHSYSVYCPPPPSPSYPAYGPPSTPPPPYGGPPSPPSYSGYEPSPHVVIKPQPPVVCLPGGNPCSPQQVDYGTQDGGHGYGNYGNSGSYGK